MIKFWFAILCVGMVADIMIADADPSPSPRMNLIQSIMKAFKAFKVAFLNTTLSALNPTAANSSSGAAANTSTPAAGNKTK